MSGAHAEVAAAALTEKNFRRGTDTRKEYEAGRLPDGRIELRSERQPAKLFLAHWHHVAYFAHYRQHPPKPYVLDILGHAHEVQVPNWPFEPSNRRVP